MNKLVLTKDNFDQVIAKNPIVVIDFWAPWCEPCKIFGVTFDKVAKQQEQVIFGSINVDDEKELTEEFAIKNIPFVMVIKDRTIIYAESGVLTETALSDLVDQALIIDVEEEDDL